jgi:putative SOS response-associated peptidase YedK
MCGRFVSASPPDELARYFDVDNVAESLLEPNWNVAPTTDIYTITSDGSARRLDAFHWGLVPLWAKDPNVGNKMINARAESLAEKNAYKHAFKRRRCLIPANGFYEWKKVPGQKAKQPYFIHHPDGDLYALAGLWEVWRGADRQGEPLHSATIITTSPNPEMAKIHDRMPVILPPSAWDQWLDPSNDDLETLGTLLVPAPAAMTVMHPVSTEVNNVRNTGAHLIDPTGQATLL